MHFDDIYTAFSQPVDLTRKFFDTPTTLPILNCKMSPLQYQHGASVVTMILSR